MALIMFDIVLFINCFLYLFTSQVQAQYGPFSTVPRLVCSLTTFSCPIGEGCCTISGCCGSDCCTNGYTCINEGTSSEGCCSVYDPTLCGTVTSSGSGSHSGDHTCTQISNCRDPTDSSSVWTCLLGQTCGLSYRDCDPCPYLGGDSDSSSTSTTIPSTTTRTSYPDASTSTNYAQTTSGSATGGSSSQNSGSYSSDVNYLLATTLEVILGAMMVWF